MTTASKELHHDYSTQAADYDRTRFETPNGRFLARTDAAIIREFVEKAGCQHILDVPTGTGRVFEYLHDFPGSIVGCDLTEEMCNIARTKMEGTNRSVVLGNAADIPFEDNHFDCVVSLRFFHLFPRRDRPRFASEFARVVQPGGSIICSFTNGWYAGGINWLRRKLGRKTVQFLHRGELAELFPDWKIEAVRGNFLPWQWRLAALGRPCENALRWTVSHTPLRSVCWERFFLLRKPEGDSAAN